MKKRDDGFTLAELLIVVAIIAVLVAVSIPIFTTQLERSREATDLANVRSAYAELMTMAISQEKPKDGSGITRTGKKGEYEYTAVVALKQTQEDWQMELPISLADVKYEGTEITGHWEGIPECEGTCTVTISVKEGTKFVWSGTATASTVTVMNQTFDYFGVMKNAITKVNTGSYCINSTCDTNNTIKNVANNMKDDTFTKDIVTWSIVRDTTKKASNTENNYLLSTFDITKLSAGTQIPAIYYLSDGSYAVGNATVAQAPDKNSGKSYNIITVDQSGNYAYTYQNVNGTMKGTANPDYNCSNLLSNSTSYSDREAAQKAYNQLVQKYLKENPDMKEGK